MFGNLFSWCVLESQNFVHGFMCVILLGPAHMGTGLCHYFCCFDFCINLAGFKLEEVGFMS
jgi:hypothetical protein